MEIRLVDKSDVIERKKSEKMWNPLMTMSEDKDIKCERSKLGMADNCAMCQVVDKEIFDRCKNKWDSY